MLKRWYFAAFLLSILSASSSMMYPVSWGGVNISFGVLLSVDLHFQHCGQPWVFAFISVQYKERFIYLKWKVEIVVFMGKKKKKARLWLLRLSFYSNGLCDSLNVIGFHNFIGSGTNRRCGFVGVILPCWRKCYSEGGLWGLIYAQAMPSASVYFLLPSVQDVANTRYACIPPCSPLWWKWMEPMKL